MQRSVAHFLGFLIPCFSLLLTFAACFLAHSRQLRQRSKGASVWECCSVVLSASRRACTERWDGSAWPGNWASWMDRARASCGGFYSDGQVDGTLHVLRLTPLFCIQILLWICFYQIPSAYYIQAMNSNLHVDGFLLPIAALSAAAQFPTVLLPLMLLIVKPILSMCHIPFSPTTRMACGQACAAGSLLVATLIELYRRTRPSMRQSLGGTSLMASSMPGLLLAPQYLLLGLADALSSPTASFLVFVTVPSSYRRAATQLSALLAAMAAFLAILLVQGLSLISGGIFFPDNMSQGHLEGFYITLGLVTFTSSLAFWCHTNRLDLRFAPMSADPLEAVMDTGRWRKAFRLYGSLSDCSGLTTSMDTT